jgi:acyl carrier protein
LWVAYASGSSDGDAFEADDLRRFLSRSVPDYMIPDTLRFALELPTSPSGKLDERLLAERQAAEAVAPTAAPTVPRTPLQADLAALWTEMLEIPQVGVDDEFFDLGGHSLAAVRMLSRVKAQFGVQVTLREFFGLRTVARLAELIERRRAEAA